MLTLYAFQAARLVVLGACLNAAMVAPVLASEMWRAAWIRTVRMRTELSEGAIAIYANEHGIESAVFEAAQPSRGARH